MKIITRGIPPKKYPWMGRWKCVYCESVIELEESDKDYGRDEGNPPVYHSDQRDGDYISVHCPVCETRRSMWPH